MSRKIKFRAYTFGEGLKKSMCRVKKIDFSDGEIVCEHEYNFKFSEVELMQFAGVKDWSGQEIYEGDIVEFLAWDLYYDDNGEVKEIKQVRKKDKVIFKDGKFMAYSTNLSELIKVEVVGNIYENKDLLDGYNS